MNTTIIVSMKDCRMMLSRVAPTALRKRLRPALRCGP
jgi:hypothetical protein